ncbi:13786_t:CDS:1, partial [Entrophospora sp. SA101]
EIYERKHKVAYKPSPSFQLGVRLFEFICNLLAVCLMAVTASGEQQLRNEIQYWVIIGLVVSTVGTVVSGIFLCERQLRFPLVETITSSLLAVGHTTFVTVGALNTPHEIKCEEYPSDLEIVTCDSPKAAVFFSFVAIMCYGFSALSAFRYWNDRRKNLPTTTAVTQNDEKL